MGPFAPHNPRVSLQCLKIVQKLGQRQVYARPILSSTGMSRVLSMSVPNPSPVLDKNPAAMGPEMLSSTEAEGLVEGSCGISRLQFCT